MKTQEKPKDPSFPFEKPIDKVADMMHDGYTLKKALYWTKIAWRVQFERELTKKEVNEIKSIKS